MASRKPKPIVVLLIAVLLALSVAAIVFVLANGNQSAQSAVTPPPAPVATTAWVVVAKQAIPLYTQLDATNIELKEVEVTTVKPGAATSLEAAFGKMNTVPLHAGDQVLQAQLNDASFATLLQPGERAFSLPINERALFGGGLADGDHVDILWSGGLEYYARVPQPNGDFTYVQSVYSSTKVLPSMQAIRVLKVFYLREPGTPPPDAAEAADGTAVEAPEVAAVPNGTTVKRIASPSSYSDGAAYGGVLVLAVNEQQAETLKFLRENGSIDLAMRPATTVDGGKGDHVQVTTTGMTVDILIEMGLIGPPETVQP